MKKLIIRAGIVVVVLVVIGLVAVFLSINSIVKKGVETVGPMITKVDVKLGSADISPLSGSGRLTKLFVGNPTGYKSPSAIEIGDIKVGVGIGSLMSDTIVVNEVNIQGAEVTLEGSLDGNNLTALLNNINGPQAAAPEPKGPGAKPVEKVASGEKKFIVKDLVLEGTKAHLSLTIPVVGNVNTTIPVPPLHLQNIGVAENGVTAGQLVQAIIKPLTSSVITAATEQVGQLGNKVKDLGKGAADKLSNATKGLGGLFQKK